MSIVQFGKGVDYFTAYTGTVTVYFPEDDIRCHWCPYCRADQGFRQKCVLNDEIIYNKDYRNDDCPLVAVYTPTDKDNGGNDNEEI